MWRFSVLLALSSISLFFDVTGQEMDRKENGDLLFASGLDCSLHSASKVGDDVCVCQGSGSYFTDRNNVSRCFKGRGEEELGKNLFFIRGCSRFLCNYHYMCFYTTRSKRSRFKSFSFNVLLFEKCLSNDNVMKN